MSEQREAAADAKLGNGGVEELEIVVVDSKGQTHALGDGEEIVWEETPDGKGVWKNRNKRHTLVKVNVRFKYTKPKEDVQ